MKISTSKIFKISVIEVNINIMAWHKIDIILYAILYKICVKFQQYTMLNV